MTAGPVPLALVQAHQLRQYVTWIQEVSAAILSSIYALGMPAPDILTPWELPYFVDKLV